MSIHSYQGITEAAAALANHLREFDSTIDTARPLGQIVNERNQLQQLTHTLFEGEEIFKQLQMTRGLDENTMGSLDNHLIVISESLEKLREKQTSLQATVDQINFDDSLGKLFTSTNQIFNRTSNAHEAAQEVETSLRGRIEDLRCGATPEQARQVQSYLKDLENAHVAYFLEQFTKITTDFKEDNQENFNNLLPFMGSLNRFKLTRTFVSDAHAASIDDLIRAVDQTLINLIAHQRATEGQPSIKGRFLRAIENKDRETFKTLIMDTFDTDLRNQLYTRINNALSSNGKRKIGFSGMGMINQGVACITEFASIEECRDAINALLPEEIENIADALQEEFDAMVLSLKGLLEESEPAETNPIVHRDEMLSEEIINSATTPVDSDLKETFKKKVLAVELLNDLQQLNSRNDLSSMHLLSHFIEQTDAEPIYTLFWLTFCLHNKLKKHQSYEDYGRVAFFSDLPERLKESNTNQNERTELINRALVLVLLKSIEEAIKADDIEGLRQQLDQLFKIRLNPQFPDFYPHDNLEYRIRGLLYEAHIDAGNTEAERNSYSDFGKAALRNEEGCCISPELKLRAIDRLIQELNAQWRI